MPPFGETIKTDDDLWKIIAWIRSVYCGRRAEGCSRPLCGNPIIQLRAWNSPQHPVYLNTVGVDLSLFLAD
jgi:hypothetical protein